MLLKERISLSAIVSGHLLFTLFRTLDGRVTWKKVTSSKTVLRVVISVTTEKFIYCMSTMFSS